MIVWQSIFYFFVIAVIGMTLFPFPIQKSVIEEGSYLKNNFIPFTFIKESMAQLAYDPQSPFPFFSSVQIVLRQVGGNILLGVPFGFLAPLIWKKRNTLLKVLIAGFWFSFTIEATQFLISLVLGYTYRMADVDDIILNSLGAMIGYGVFKIVCFFSKYNLHRAGPT